MALPQSALSELLDAFRTGDGVDLIRDAVRLVLQELSELEATERIGAARYERSDTRVTDRNVPDRGHLETALQRLHQPGVLVTDHQPDTTEAAPLERGQEWSASIRRSSDAPASWGSSRILQP